MTWGRRVEVSQMDSTLMRRWLIVAVILIAILAAVDPANAQFCVLDPLGHEKITCI